MEVCKTPLAGDETTESSARKRRRCALMATKIIKESLKVVSKKQRTILSRNSPVPLTCCIRISPKCDVDVNSVHILTKTELACSACYHFVHKKPNGLKFEVWKEAHVEESRCRAVVNNFIQDIILPYWVKCSKCTSYRCFVSEKCIDSQDIVNFQCENCEEPEDKAVLEVIGDPDWLKKTNTFPYFQRHPALIWLKGQYYCDETGMSPVETKFDPAPLIDASFNTTDFLLPFHIPHTEAVASCCRPDTMEKDELEEFVAYANEQRPFLAARNLIIAIWSCRPFEYLTLKKCLEFFVCRGHSRIWLSEHLIPQTYNFLMRKGCINVGAVTLPPEIQQIYDKKVIVVGAGISGLVAARQLKMQGVDVTILEGRNRAGGRMKDTTSMGVAAGCGAQLVVGVHNNPISLMYRQLGLDYLIPSRTCPLLDALKGGIVDKRVDDEAETHFNFLLESAAHGKTSKQKSDVVQEDCSLLSVLNKNHREILRRSGMKWTPLHERLLQFHMGNLEFACGSSLADVSWRCWDQNEDMPSFAGRHALLVDGTAPIITKLTEQLDINFDIKVKNIEYERKDENDGYPIRIATEDALGNRKSFECDMVLCTMPLKVLQTSPDLFSPPLSGEKVAALKGIGAGLIEKVIVRFSEPFWEEYFEPGNFFFGHVPKVPEQRTVFNLFHDFSKRDGPVENRSYVLMSYLGGRSVDLVNEKSDEQIVELFVDVLKSLFPKKSDKIKAIDSFVTHWGKNAFTGMSYSYVKINGTGDDYDTIAKSVDDKVFFAGEHTCRFYPQTMTGSAMSGYREAGKILQILHKEKQ